MDDPAQWRLYKGKQCDVFGWERIPRRKLDVVLAKGITSEVVDSVVSNRLSWVRRKEKNHVICFAASNY